MKLDVVLQLLHRGSLCNRLLPVVERGFKHVDNNVKIAAFEAWQSLIDNYALNPGIIGSLACCQPHRRRKSHTFLQFDIICCVFIYGCKRRRFCVK